MWWHRRRRSAPEEAADIEQLKKDLRHAHDSVVVAKKRITGEDVKGGASLPVIYASSDGGSNCGNRSSGDAAGAGRVPMVAFLDLPEEEQKRLRAGNINDSVLIMRNKRATSGSGAAGENGGEAAVTYYQQQLERLKRSSDGGSSSSGGAEEAAGQPRGRSSDGSESGKRVQFGAAQVVAVTSAAGSASAAGGASEAGAAPAAAVAAAPGFVLPEHAAGDALLPGGVDGDSICIDASEGTGQRRSRGDDTARIGEAPLPGSAS
ncbi:hypothetical protein OEZ85_005895 [Tetradesmus obliquus]|uniref:Uncharacterized protein n=1 Tax=Tetradesmus obliquus TaxID=3088 RepID=A0ABY8UIM9_TETOB|nr:hypothetical protein OEZ85_005895 [Tetradesmus obliquus]